MHGSNNNFWFCNIYLPTINTKYKKKKHWLCKLTKSVTIAQLLILHAYITVQKPRVCFSCKCLVVVWGVLEKRNHVDIFESIESPFLIYLDSQPTSYTQCVIIAWEETTQFTIKILENTHTKNLRLKIEAVTKMDDYFTICQYKIKKPKNDEISTPTYLEV